MKTKTIYLLFIFIISTFLILFIKNNTSVYAEKNDIKIAVMLSKTGIAAKNYQNQVYAARLAINEINLKGGLLGRKIELIELDNQSTPLGSKTAAKEAVAKKVSAVIGCFRSSNSLAAAPILQKAKIIMISPGSTNPKVTEVGNYIFRVCFLNSLQGKVMANFARFNLKSKTAVVLTNTTHSYSIDLSNYFIKQYKKLGGDILWQGDYIENMSDYKNVLTKTKQLSPDIIYLPGYSTDAALVMQQAKKMGIKSIFLGGDGWSSKIFDKENDAINGNYKTDHWFVEIKRPQSKLFVKKYSKQFKQQPDTEAALVYDALSILFHAIKRSKSLDTTIIRKQLAGTKNFRGVTGRISFDKNRNPIKPAIILKIMNGKFIYIKSVNP